MEVNLTETQEKLLYKLVPAYGESPQDVLGFIITDWIHHNSEPVMSTMDVHQYIQEDEKLRCCGGHQCQ